MSQVEQNATLGTSTAPEPHEHKGGLLLFALHDMQLSVLFAQRAHLILHY